MKKQYIALLSALLMLAVLITGCAPKGGTTTTTTIATTTTVAGDTTGTVVETTTTTADSTTAADSTTTTVTDSVPTQGDTTTVVGDSTTTTTTVVEDTTTAATTTTVEQVTTTTTAPVEDDDDGRTPVVFPGTENWIDAENAVTLVVDNEKSHVWDCYGLYLTHPNSLKYTQLTDEQREIVNKVIFDDLNVGMVGCNFPLIDYHTTEDFGYYVQNFGETLGWGDGCIIEEGVKRGLSVDICSSGQTPYYMLENGQGTPLKDEYVEKYAQMLARAAYDMKEYYGINVKLMGTGDEPDLNGDIQRYQNPLLVKTMRYYLDKYGLTDTLIACNEDEVFSIDGVQEVREDPEAWAALDTVTGHDFGTGIGTKQLWQCLSAWNRPGYSTSSGYDRYDEILGDWLKRDANGTMSVEDYMKAVQNSCAILSDMNLGISGYLTFNSVIAFESTSFAGTTDYSLVYYDVTGGVNLSALYAISANYKYTQQINWTTGQDCDIYKSYLLNDDGSADWMTERDNWSREQFNDKMVASAGRNTDGTWGINILNKTDEEVYNSMRQHSMKPMAAETIPVNLDVRSLYGTGVQEFEMWSITPQSTVSEMIGTVTLVDGRGYVEVFPFELMSLRSVNPIDDNHVADEHEDLFKDSGVVYMDYDFAYIRGEKVDLKKAPYRTKTSLNGWCTNIALEDLATLLEGTYTRKGNEITVSCEWETFTFTLGGTFVKHSGGSGVVPAIFEKDGVPMLTLTSVVLKMIATQTGYRFEDIDPSVGLIMIQYDEYDIDTPITNLYRLASRFEKEAA